ncbi:MAG: uracil-DNA glycosylase [Gammaproteobacteria bacterium]|nr:uracil-DNA glycosylase [Gammaproteobacteria bacterium]
MHLTSPARYVKWRDNAVCLPIFNFAPAVFNFAPVVFNFAPVEISVTPRDIQLNRSWLVHLQAEFDKQYMQKLAGFLRAEKAAGKTIYPAGTQIFAALNATPLDDLKVVILGQDPYHGPNQAHGLSFSVPPGVAIPPSLKNIYKELLSDIGGRAPEHGNLQAWAEQGVLLLNSVLTVQQGNAGSHQNRGWERFTDAVISIVDANCEHVVFLLWGAYAQAKGQRIDRQRHLVLHAPHPSPLSAHRGFLGCRHFSRCNDYLKQHGYPPIDWQIG